MNDYQANQIKSKRLEGLKFVITGTLSLSRERIQELIAKNSGEVVNSLTKNTHYLIVGDNPGSKLAKAKELGTLLLNEQEFRIIVGE